MVEDLVHYGVKGMKWGIRKEDETGTHRFQAAPELKIDPALHSSTKSAAKEMASLISGRYGLQITEIVGFGPGHPEYEAGTTAFVTNSKTGKRQGTIHVSTDDLRPILKNAESNGWLGPGTGNLKGVLTHETAHALFHSNEVFKTGFLGGVKVSGGDIKARDKAFAAALKASRKDGIPDHLFKNYISGYATTANVGQETEAELFSQYHWRTDPPRFITVWGETLHKEMGLDHTPFKERR